jgi:hypothetical protein
MTSTRLFGSALVLMAVSLVGCAVETPADQDEAIASAYAAVEAGACMPDCGGRVCGLDPICGISCGECRTGQRCDESVGQCKAECMPDCSGRTCGVDPVCGVSCGSCGDGTTCNEDAGVCETRGSGGAGGSGGGGAGGKAGAGGTSGGGAGGKAGAGGTSGGGGQGHACLRSARVKKHYPWRW